MTTNLMLRPVLDVFLSVPGLLPSSRFTVLSAIFLTSGTNWPGYEAV
jgi:hypothetical protein